jgi:hypothetical protein
MVNMVKKAKNPKYWSNSNILVSFCFTKIVGKRETEQMNLKKT